MDNARTISLSIASADQSGRTGAAVRAIISLSQITLLPLLLAPGCRA
ncbi:hypothetical protein ACLO87_13160 [Paenalcaligenes sp. Me52]